jgi:hypothetical protein
MTMLLCTDSLDGWRFFLGKAAAVSWLRAFCRDAEATELDALETRRGGRWKLSSGLNVLDDAAPSLDGAARRHLDWAERTFDPIDRRSPAERAQVCLRHAVREIEKEIAPDPRDPREYADALALLLFAARLNGITPQAVAAAWEAKIPDLEARTWERNPESGLIEHVRQA